MNTVKFKDIYISLDKINYVGTSETRDRKCSVSIEGKTSFSDLGTLTYHISLNTNFDPAPLIESFIDEQERNKRLDELLIEINRGC